MKKLLAILFSMALAAGLSAQTTMRVEVPNVVASDEQFNVTFILEGEDSPSDFQWDQGDDFQLVWGPQQGRSTSIQVMNGKRTKSSQFTYTYILMPKKTGTFTLPQASAKVKGKEITSSPVSVEVVSSSSSGGSSVSGQGGSRADNVTGISDEDEHIYIMSQIQKTAAEYCNVEEDKVQIHEIFTETERKQNGGIHFSRHHFRGGDRRARRIFYGNAKNGGIRRG